MSTEKTAGMVEAYEHLVFEHDGEPYIEEVLFVAWSDDGDRLIWTETSEVGEPLVFDESALVTTQGDAS